MGPLGALGGGGASLAVAPATPAARTIYYDSIVSAWCRFTTSAGVPSITKDFNISSITDNGAGDFTFNFATNIGSANYAPVFGTSGALIVRISTQAVGSSRAQWTDTSSTGSDPANASMVLIGE